MDAKIKARTPEQHLAQCKKLYEKIGPTAAYEYGKSVGLPYSHCTPCNADTPSAHGRCALCGTSKYNL